MLDYILKSSACLLVLLLFYKLILERENMHQLKRFYLLFATVLGFTIPFITITTYVEPTYTLGTFQPPLLEPVFYPETTQPTEQNTNFWPILLWSIYGIGVLLFLVKFMVNLTKLIVKIKTNPKLKSKNIINVLINNLEIPHTFLSYIFLNKTKFENNQIPEEVLLHEHTHATQKHSLDILFIELLQIVFWFNPIIYFLKKDIKLNHEYLADQAVLQQGTQINTYQHLLLAFSSTHGGNELTNAINYSSIKKRLTVMKTQTSSTKKWIKTLVVLPLLAILIFGFSKKEEVVKEVTPLITENNHTTSPPVLEVKKNQSLLLLNNENTSLESLGEDFLSITKGEKSDLKIISEENIKMSFIEQISEALKPNLLQIYFESEYGITHENFNFNSDKEIINKHIENKPLLEFINGIKTDCNQCAVSKSLIGQLAITTTLDETVEEFKIQFKNEDAFLVKGNQLDARAQELLKKMNHDDLVFIYDIKTKFKTFKNKIQLKAKVTKQDKNERKIKTLKINDIECQKCTINLHRDEIKNIVLSDEVKYFSIKTAGTQTMLIKGNKLNSEVAELLKYSDEFLLFNFKYTNKYDEKTNSDFILVKVIELKNNKGVTKEELKEYNTLAKHINSQISESEYPIVKHKDAVRVKYLYNKMSKEQKESAEAFPDFSKLPPPPAPDPNVKTGFITINNSTHYYVTQNGNTKYYNRYGQETNKEGTIINDTQVDGDKVVPGQKITKVYKDNKVVSEFNKNWDQDVPPPPPPPKSPLDHIIDMAKKGAAFYYEGKSISSDEAIALLKKNNELNISTQQTDSKQAKVYITKAPVSIKN
ncbi:M56 family metallopeptidase [Meridianimaribacter flavus]